MLLADNCPGPGFQTDGCPVLVEIQEQRMLPFLPSVHPWTSHPDLVDQNLPLMRGTLEVAQSLGYLKYHAVVRDPQDRLVPFPWIGDVLLFLRDELGPYCVNWTAKERESDFSRPFRSLRKGPCERVIARHQVEEVLFADAQIKTVRILNGDLDPVLSGNLKRIFYHASRPLQLGHDTVAELSEALRIEVLSRARRPVDAIRDLARRTGSSPEQVKIVFYNAIRTRDLKANLFEPIEYDELVEPERVNPYMKYASWFSRAS